MKYNNSSLTRLLHFREEITATLSELISPKKALKKINSLIKFIERDGVMEGIGKLLPNLSE